MIKVLLDYVTEFEVPQCKPVRGKSAAEDDFGSFGIIHITYIAHFYTGDLTVFSVSLFMTEVSPGYCRQDNFRRQNQRIVSMVGFILAHNS